jgi:hypothetical protein
MGNEKDAVYIWDSLKCYADKYTLKRKENDFIIIGSNQALELVWNLFSKGGFSPSMQNCLREIVQKDSELKALTLERMLYFLPELLEKHFLYELVRDEKMPFRTAFHTFTAYVEVLSILSDGKFEIPEKSSYLFLLMKNWAQFAAAARDNVEFPDDEIAQSMVDEMIEYTRLFNLENPRFIIPPERVELLIQTINTYKKMQIQKDYYKPYGKRCQFYDLTEKDKSFIETHGTKWAFCCSTRVPDQIDIYFAEHDQDLPILDNWEDPFF